jgi:DNA-binding IclR family transcriptional regulator
VRPVDKIREMRQRLPEAGTVSSPPSPRVVSVRGSGRASAHPAADSATEAESPVGLELISKVDAVISALERQGEMTAAELAHSIDEPLSSMYRMLQSLSSVGWVDRSPRRGRYRLGLAMMTIGRSVEDSLDIREVARPSLQLLLNETKSTSFLCVARGSRAVCLERLEGYSVRSLAMQLGSSLPMYAGAAPLALLAFLPEAERELVLSDRYQVPGDPRRPGPDELEHTLAEVRRRGLAVSDGDVTPGIAALGAPVFNHRHELVASISISGVRAQILGSKLRHNSTLMLQAARAVSASLGDETSR